MKKNYYYPTLVKIDVDGIEDLIIEGGEKLLSNKKCQSVLVEVNENFFKQYENIQRLLKRFNFRLVSENTKKSQLKVLATKPLYKKVYNQIWVKN